MKRQRTKNPFNGKFYTTRQAAIAAIERYYPQELFNLNVTAKQALFNHRNGYSLDNQTGKSIRSGKPTPWNERTGKYERFADEKERQAYREEFLNRMKRIHGVEHLLDDPEQQRRMLERRKISGTYTFKDGGKKNYVGQREKEFLEFLDRSMAWPSQDLHLPAPFNIHYKDEHNKARIYIPDVWIESKNLLVEIKGEYHEGYRKRELERDRRKWKAVEKQFSNFLVVVASDFTDLIERLSEED